MRPPIITPIIPFERLTPNKIPYPQQASDLKANHGAYHQRAVVIRTINAPALVFIMYSHKTQ